MVYKKIDNTYIVRLNRGEEVISEITNLCIKENIKLGNISGLGATDNLTVGLYNVEEKKYHKNNLIGAYEITSIIGNISTMNNKPYLHIHVTVADQNSNAFGGHLNECHISATCEMIITKIDGEIDRFLDEETGLNLYNI